jgi:hypothetical protein
VVVAEYASSRREGRLIEAKGVIDQSERQVVDGQVVCGRECVAMLLTEGAAPLNECILVEFARRGELTDIAVRLGETVGGAQKETVVGTACFSPLVVQLGRQF